MKDIFDLLARLCLATIFLFEAYDSIQYYDHTQQTMTDYGITWRQDVLLVTCIVLLIVGGCSLLIGYHAKLGAILLLLYWVPVTLIVYSFWNDPLEVRRLHSILFMKNIAIIGGLLMVLVNGTGKYSIRRLLDVRRLPA